MNKFKILSTVIVSLMILAIITLFIMLILYERSGWVVALVAIGVVTIDIGFGIYIMNSKRHTYTKACWLFCLLLLPLVGCLFFVVFGTFPMSRKD
jgi:hypothetical protein